MKEHIFSLKVQVNIIQNILGKVIKKRILLQQQKLFKLTAVKYTSSEVNEIADDNKFCKKPRVVSKSSATYQMVFFLTNK